MSIYVDIEKKIGSFNLKIKFEAENEVISLLGESGCGKSMTLKCIAGIEKPDKGRIILDDVTLFDSEKKINLKPQKRNIGYLFQQYALFPNMTVESNIRCGIKDKSREKELLDEIINKMGLEGLENLKPAALSGGQQQRVALARILVGSPNLIMLDEPFSALDSHLRFRLEQTLRDTIKEFGKTVIFVSHNRDEVYRLSEKIAVLKNGHIDAIGRRKELFNEPSTPTSAILTGCKNVAKCDVIDSETVYIPDWDLTLKTASDTKGVTHIGLRMHNLHIGEGKNSTEFDVLEVIENPFSFTLMLRVSSNKDALPINIELNKKDWYEHRNEKLNVWIKPEKIILLRDSLDS